MPSLKPGTSYLGGGPAGGAYPLPPAVMSIYQLDPYHCEEASLLVGS
jgi:hypothetical protein